MIINDNFLFDDLDDISILILKRIDIQLRNGYIPFEHSYIKEWLTKFECEESDKLTIITTVFHNKLLQSINDFLFKKVYDEVTINDLNSPKICNICNNECNELSGNPGDWSIMLPVPSLSGKLYPHHYKCIIDKVYK